MQNTVCSTWAHRDQNSWVCIVPECFGWLLLLEVNDTKPLNSFKSLFSMISVLALGCLCFVSPTAVCFFTLLFAAQKPLLLLLIGLKENAVPLETYGHSGEQNRKKERTKAWNKLEGSWEIRAQVQEPSAKWVLFGFLPPSVLPQPSPCALHGSHSLLCLRWKVTKDADFIRRKRVNLRETLIYQTLLKRPEVNAKVTFP